MKKTIAVILALVMLCSVVLTGCSLEDILGKFLGSDQDKFIGQWSLELDMTDMLTDLMGTEMAEMSDYFTFENVVLILNWEFKKDGTYSMSVDEDSLQDLIDNLTDSILGGLEGYLEEYLKSMGLNMTMEEFLAYSGITVEDLIQEMNLEGSLKEAMGDLSVSGRFKAEDGRLYTNDDVTETELSSTEVVYYEFVNGNIELDGFIDMEDNEQLEEWVEELLPLVLKPAK